jgi:uncharacterized protein (DUF2141 family)
VTKHLLSAIAAIMLLCCGASPSSPPTTQPQATLRIEVTDLRALKGQLIFGVFKQADGFPTEPKKSVNWQIKPADAKTVIFECQLPPGRYGASVLHDENNNGKMDKNGLGIPKEGYGVTNNPKPKLRAATFEESLFDLPADGAALKISVQYF